jgi:tetratricopeptide (TPR) repeat protein
VNAIFAILVTSFAAVGFVQDPPAKDTAALSRSQTESAQSIDDTVQEDDQASADKNAPNKEQEVVHPTNVELTECLNLVEQGEFDSARRRAHALVEKYPQSARAHLLLGLSYHKARHYEQARPHLEKAIELDPGDLPIRIFLGWCLYNLGEAEQSRAMFEVFISHRPDYADAHFALGLLDFADGEMESAERRFEQAIMLAGRAKSTDEEAKALLRLSDVYVATGRLEEAKGALMQSIRHNARLYSAWFKLSRVFDRLGDEEAAIKARAMHERVRSMVRPPGERVEE